MKVFTKSFLVIFLFFTLFSTNKLQANSLLGDSFSAIGDGSSEEIEDEIMDSQVYTSVDEVTDNNADIVQVPDEQDNNDDDDDDDDGDDEASEEDSKIEEALIEAEDQEESADNQEEIADNQEESTDNQEEIADNSDDSIYEAEDNDVVQISGIEADSDTTLGVDATSDFSYYYKFQPTIIDKSLNTKDVCFSNQFKIIEGIRKYNKNNKTKMTSLDLKVLKNKNAYMSPIDLPTEKCEYATEGDVTNGGYVYCKYHGCEGRDKCLETLRILTKAVNDYNASHDANDRLSEFDDSDIGKLISSKCLAEQPSIGKNCSYTSFGDLNEGGKIYCERHGEIDISIPEEESDIQEIADGKTTDDNKTDTLEQIASSTNVELGKLLTAEDIELNSIASRIRKKINKNYYICQSFCTDGKYWYVAFTTKSKLLANNKHDFANQKTLLLKFKRNEQKSKAPKLIAKRKMGKIGHCNSMTYNDKTKTILIAPSCIKDGMTMPLRQIDVKTFFNEKKLKTSSKGKAIFLKIEDGLTEVRSPDTKYQSIVYDSKNDQYIAKISVASTTGRLCYLGYFDADFKLKKANIINNLDFKIKKEFVAQSITTDGTNIFSLCNDKISSTRVNYIIPFDMEGNRVGQIIVLKNKPSNKKKVMQHMIYSDGEYYIASNGNGKFIVDRVYLKEEKDDDDDDSSKEKEDNSTDGNKLVTLTKFDTTGKKGYSKPFFKSLTVPAKYVASKTHVEQMWYAAKLKKSVKGLSKGDKILVIRKSKGLCIIQKGNDKGKVIKLSKKDYDLCQQITNCRVVYSKETVEKFMNDHKVTSKTNYAIWINKHIQHAFYFKKKGGKWVLYEDSPFKKGVKVSTGSYKNSTRCDTGYSINHCEIFNHDDGFQGIKRYMHYSSPGGNGLHGTTGTGKPLSHGCVRFDTKIRDYIWEKIPLHTRVILH